jgi:acyl CoA:acetate/3-ketoacid CoA transferase alpha subunit
MFSIPVALSYNGQDYIATMGPFERSMERDFALIANKKALDECNDIEKLKEVAWNMMQGWSNMQDATASLVKENLELRQAMQMQQMDLEAADQLLGEAGEAIKAFAEQQQSSQARRFLWPFGK